MTVRLFTPEYSRSEFGVYESPPYLSPITCNEAVTFTALVKFGPEEDQYIWTQIEGSAVENYGWGMEDGRLAMRSKGVVSKAASYVVPREKWLLVTYTKAAGTAKPKFYVWDYEAEALTVVEGSLALEDALDDGNRWMIGNAAEIETGERFTGAIAAHAIWEDTLSEAEILTGLIEVTYLADWGALSTADLRGLWYWNDFEVDDRSPSQNVYHGGTNTTIDEEEDPPVPYQAPEPPVIITPPTIGAAEEGKEVVHYFAAASGHGEWDGLPNSSYEAIWERSEDEGETWKVVSRTGYEYEFTTEDEGNLIRCSFYAKNTYGKSDPCVVGPLGPIEPADAVDIPVNTVAPVLSGTPKVGLELSVDDGTWTDAAGHWYGWYVSETGEPGTWIAAATGGSSKYLEPGVDDDLYIKARVGAYKEGGGLTSVYSNVLGPIEPEEEDGSPVNLEAPTITGTLEDGETLEGHQGAWKNEPESYVYQWEESATGVSGWTPIGGETATTLLLGEAFAGLYLRFRVEAINEAGTAQAVSAKVGPVPGGEEPETPESGVFMLIDGDVVEVERFVLIGGDLVPV